MDAPLARPVVTDRLRFTEAAYAPGFQMARHAHAEAQLSLVVAGSLEEQVGRGAAQPGALCVGIKPAGVEHANLFGRGGALVASLALRPAFLAALGPKAPALGAWRWLRGGAAVPHLLGLLRAARHEPEALKERLEDEAWDLVGALERAALAEVAGPPPRWLERARERVCETFSQGVATHALAAEAGVHPVSLARAFRRHYGESVSECVRRLRLQRAAHLITTTEQPLAQVAAEAGFSDQSHLTRTLRAEAAVTPAALRALAGLQGRRLGSF